jgi:hypothetical protein
VSTRPPGALARPPAVRYLVVRRWPAGALRSGRDEGGASRRAGGGEESQETLAGVGWLFGDEGDERDTCQSFSYTVAWRPDVKLEDAEYRLPGERGGEYFAFRFRFNGQLFVTQVEEATIRLAVHDPMAPQDFRGLPFLRAFPYIGTKGDILSRYGKADLFAFVPLLPLDLIQMDALYRRSKVIFVGVTPTFGPHAQERRPNS